MRRAGSFASLLELGVILILSCAFCSPPPSRPEDVLESQSGPRITSLSQSSGSTAGGTLLTIEGEDFTADTQILIGDRAATPVSVRSGTRILATVPEHVGALGPVPIVARNGKGEHIRDDLFSYYSSQLGFSELPVIFEGGTAQSIVSADMNGDGHLDLIFGLRKDIGNRIVVLLGDGQGSFRAAQGAGVFDNPVELAVADWNGDLKLDVVVAFAGNELILLLGDGQGGLGQETAISRSTTARLLTVGDWNGDARPDLALQIIDQNNLVVLLNDGMGGFGAPIPLPSVASQPTAVVVGDVSGDSKTDLIVSGQDGAVSVLLGNGMGGFALVTRSSACASAVSGMALGDWNRDAKLDVAVMCGYFSNTTAVLLGNGTGGFSAPTVVSMSPGGSLQAGDWNGDGVLDLAACGGDHIYVQLGKGDGSFTSSDDFLISTGFAFSYQFVVGDWNRDGKSDVAIATYDGVRLLFGSSLGGLGPLLGPVVGNSPCAVAAADFDNDQKPDLAIANCGDNDLSVLLGDGRGGFDIGRRFATGARPSAIVTGHWNGDGNLDLAVTNHDGDSVSVLLGDGRGGFSTVLPISVGSQPRAIVAGDWNGDQKPDLVVANYGSANFHVLLGDGQGSFAATAYSDLAALTAVAAGDWNHDQKLDLVLVSAGASHFTVRYGDGRGGFAGGATTLPIYPEASAVVVGDWDDDHNLDLAITSRGSSDGVFPPVLQLLFGNGQGSFFGSNVSLRIPIAVLASDFDVDQKIDLAVLENGGLFSVLINNRVGSFLPPQKFIGTSHPIAMAAADFDGDKRPDVVLVSDTTGGVVIARNTSK